MSENSQSQPENTESASEADESSSEPRSDASFYSSSQMMIPCLMGGGMFAMMGFGVLFLIPPDSELWWAYVVAVLVLVIGIYIVAIPMIALSKLYPKEDGTDMAPVKPLRQQ